MFPVPLTSRVAVGATLAISGIAVFGIAAASTASAATVAALQDGRTIAIIDTDTKKVTSTATVAGGARLVGIDVRPADGKLYGLTQDGTIVVLDARSGKWDRKSQLSEKLPAGARITVDFNPVADRMRVLASDGTSLRINVEDGKATVDGRLRYADTDTAKGMQPRVTAGAYTNSAAGMKETTLFDIDATAGTLVRQAPPNDGVLNTIGKLGIKVDNVAFDIMTDAQGSNSAWLLSGGTFYSVDLGTGAAKRAFRIQGLKGTTVDMAVLR